jgi:outer membrane protein assembly factor BamB
MESEMLSMLISILIVTNISGAITPNVGVSSLSHYRAEGIIFSDISTPILQIVDQQSSNSSGSDGLADSPWPMFRQNLNHTGLSPYNTITNSGKLKWYFLTGHQVESSPAISSDGIIYVGSSDHKLYAIHLNGSEIWSFLMGSYVKSSPLISSDGTVYVGSNDCKLYAINPNGTEKWHFTTGDYIVSSPAIDINGTIYVGSYDNKLYAINPDGTKKWSFKTSGKLYSSPAIGYDGTIYIGSYDNKLYAINPDGSKKWHFTTGDIIESSPSIGLDNTIYFGSYDDKLYAINPDGTEKWSFNTPNIVHSSPALGSDGTIYVGCAANKLYAINLNGTEKWNFPTTGDVWSPSIGSDGTIYVGSDSDYLHAINPNGTERWSFFIGDDVRSSPAIGSDGTIYIGSDDYKLYAIGKMEIPPISDVGSSQTLNEGDIVPLNASASYDPDGTIVTYEWDFESDGIYDYVETTNASPDGNFDGKTTHIYGDNGEYKVTLRVTDETGLNDTDTSNITVNNIAPIIDTLPAVTINEFENVTLIGHATDPGSDDLIFIWSWEYTPWSDKTTIYYNDGTGPDSYPSPTINPGNITENATCQFGDDGIFTVNLTVTDDDGGSTTVMTNITVNNVNPTVTIESITMDVELGLRVAGRKYNDVSMILYEEGNSMGYVSIERLPGSPNEQMAWIPITLDMTKVYSATVNYTPEGPPNVGGNPVWIYIKFQNGTIEKIHHTFNVQQSKKKNSEHWNHVEPWEVDLNVHLIGHQFEVTSYITDLGSDDENLTYIYGSQSISVIYLNNPPEPDPYPSPEVNPRDIFDITTLLYQGPDTIILIVKDDDNIRLDFGQGINVGVVS